MSEITLKIKYSTENSSRIKELIKNYNSLFGLTYNYMFENKKSSTKSIFEYINSKNNIFLDTYFKNGAIFDAKGEIAKDRKKKIVFGGKKLFLKRQNNKISKEDYKIAKLRPLNVVGAAYNHGNCKFQVISENEILFKPSSKEHFSLKLETVGKNYQKYLKILCALQKEDRVPITYKLGLDYVYASFDIADIMSYKKVSKKKDRIFAIDLNPNYIGWTVVDWKNSETHSTIKAGVISLKDLNDFDNSLNAPSHSSIKKKIANKRNFETIQIAHQLVKLANHYHCMMFALEDLSIESSDKGKGKKYNKLCNNQWNRRRMTSTLEKLCSLYEIIWRQVMANFSSFEGNLIYRREKLPDMCLSSIEIGRRGYEFYHQYILKDFVVQKNIIFDTSRKAFDNVAQSLEELSYKVAFQDLAELYYSLKKVKCKYRFSIEDAIKEHLNSFSSKNFIKAYTKYYYFI